MKRVSICDRLDALPKAYEEIFTASGNVSFFFSFPWFQNFAETVLASNERVRVYGVETPSSDGGLSMALIMRHEIPGPGKIAARKLSALGNYYTPLFAPSLNDQPFRQEDLNQLAAAVAAERPKWDMVDLHPLEAEDAFLDGMLLAFRRTGMMAASYFSFGNWYLEVNNRSYHAYLATLPSKLQNTLRRKTARLTNAGRLRIEIITGDEHLNAAIAAFEEVYASSWKTPEPYPLFIPGLIRTCADQGSLRLGIAYIDGKPAAGQLWIVHAGIASIYKLAYDEKYSAESVGSILTARLMEHVIDVDRVRQVDFLSGDDPYKKDWMSHRRERRGIIAYNLRTARGLAGALKHLSGRCWKKIVASGITRRRNVKSRSTGDPSPQ